jgi:protein-tyrosine-phosphatase
MPQRVLSLCSGNAVRSPMVEAMLGTLDPSGAHWIVRSAGTHATEGMAVSARTLEAVVVLVDVDILRLRSHRTHQLTPEDVAWADVILTAEADHVAFCRARYPEATSRVAQLGAFCRFAPLDAPFAEQLRDAVSELPDDQFDVADPAGGDQADYDVCARTLWDLAQTYAVIVGAGAE